MGLIRKRSEIAVATTLYTTAASKNILVVGLGNTGEKYNGTRHNIGFAVLDDFANRNEFPAWQDKKDLKCHISTMQMGDARVILAKPTTFMNNSGEAAQAVQHYFRVYNSDTVVAYDELALKFGQIRARVGGSDAGHNGIKSLSQYIGEEFGRLRIGVANSISEKAEASDFVLGKFTKAEQGHLPAIVKEAGVMITEYIYSGELPHDTRTIL